MKRILITLGHRVPFEGENTSDVGNLVVIDWDTKEVRRFPINGRTPIDKGRSRGASGLDFFEGSLFVASRGDLIALHPNIYEEQYRVNIGYPRGIHQIKAHEDILWLACMERNCKQAVKNGKVIDLVPTKYSGIDENTKPPGCFNALTWSPNGDEFHMYTGPEEIYNFTQRKVVIKGNLGTGPHDLCFLNENELLFTRSLSRELVRVNLDSGDMEVIFSSLGSLQANDWNFAGFMRGIEYSKKDDSVFVMSGPGILYELDIKTWRVKQDFDFLYDYNLKQEEIESVCPFDILLDPRDWR
jgi:hypothetical protein